MTQRVDVQDRKGIIRRVCEGPFPIRVTKTARLWLAENGPQELADIIAAAPLRGDEAAQVLLNHNQLRDLWQLMDKMLDEMLLRRYTPGVNSATGMQRKAESFIPSLPW